MHWPHLIQRNRNFSSESDPGGRIIKACQFSPMLLLRRTAGKAVNPPSRDITNPLRLISGDAISPAGDGSN